MATHNDQYSLPYFEVAIKKTEANSRSLKLKFRCISLGTDISQLKQNRNPVKFLCNVHDLMTLKGERL